MTATGTVRAVVSITRGADTRPVDTELQVATLDELYGACRAVAPGQLVRVTLLGPDGELRTNFAGLRRDAE